MSRERKDGIEQTVFEQREKRRENPVPIFFEIENPEMEEVYSYPLMLPGEKRIRGDKLGNIWLRSFRETDEYNELGHRKVLVRWSRFETIEDAMKGPEHIRNKYHPEKGEEVLRVLEIKNATMDLMDRIKSGEVNSNNIAEEREKIAQLLANTHYLDATKFRKRKMADFVFRSVSPDSLNRSYNPSRSLLLEAHVVEDAEDEQTFQKLGFAKYDFIPEELSLVRNGVISDLEQIGLLMQKIEGMGGKNPERDTAISVLSHFVKEKTETDKPIPNPYLRALVISKILVNGQTGLNDAERLVQLIKNPEEIKRYLTQIPLVSLRSERRIQTITNLCRAEIRKALNDGAIAMGEKEPPTPAGLFG